MTSERIDRRALKASAQETLADAQVSPKAFTALYLAMILAMDLVDCFTGTGMLSNFVYFLIVLLGLVLKAGLVLYCMAVRRGERAEFLTLFDGFSFAGKVIALNILKYLLIFLWSMLFTIPGIIAAYRYRFALYNLCEDPGLSIWQALDMSSRQSRGYKAQLLSLDISYLGWTLLAGLPAIIYSAAAYQALLPELLALYGVEAVVPAASAELLLDLLPVWGWTLVIGLWKIPFSMFYLPCYQCVTLDYFETAKRTSGIGFGVPPRSGGPFQNGPDGLGGC